MTDDKRTDPWLGQPSDEQSSTEDTAALNNTEAAAKAGSDESKWQRDMIERLAFSALQEQRRSRRWSIFFKAIFFLYLVAVFFAYTPGDLAEKGITGGDHTAMVEIKGVIADDSEANSEDIISGLDEAFENKGTKGVILRINSPGGSPVQAGYVYDEIKRLREKHPDIHLYAVITDLCASGGYYIASAADKIYADKASIVGSIGVLMNGFGFVGTMDKLGVERRLFTAGAHKGFLDPFSPVKEEEKAHLDEMLETIHQQFIDAVKNGRKDRLSNDPNLFSGLMWTGEKAVGLGLVDGLANTDYVAKKIIGADNIVDFTHHEPAFQKFLARFGATMARSLVSAAAGTIQ